MLWVGLAQINDSRLVSGSDALVNVVDFDDDVGSHCVEIANWFVK